ncbi:hypothetical protein EIP86_001912 [Pleurotus ostreatoroseus]|nr:hypothetical protein EIP86_001912 [Pleurotus ostreatoroseus]
MSRTAVETMMKMANLSVKDFYIMPAESMVKRVRETVYEWNFDHDTETKKREERVVTSVHLGAMSYGHTSIDVQCHIALYSYLLLVLDDLEIPTLALDEFSSRLCAGMPQLHPVLTALNENLSRMSDYYPPYTSQSILISTFQFINACAFERTTSSMALHPDAVMFPGYKRIRSGVGEAYIFFAWDKFRFPDITVYVQIVPDMTLFISYVNDIFSFYKEELVGEKYNYIHDLSTVTGKDTASVLINVAQGVAEVTRRSRAMLAGDARLVLEEFIRGYILFHLMTPRYGVKHYLDVGMFIGEGAN